jgi:hypothetical protein
MSDEEQMRRNTQHKHTTNTTTMVVERQPLRRCGFDESMSPKGQAALCIPLSRPPSNSFDRFIKLMWKLIFFIKLYV